VEQVPVWVGVISLQKDSFTDGGFRLRKNDLLVKDHILGLDSKNIEFIDYEYFCLDTYSKKGWDYSDPEYAWMKPKQAELWFRNSDHHKQSTLTIKTLLDLLSSVAGIPNFILLVVGMVVWLP
jgi:hypothetical protein